MKTSTYWWVPVLILFAHSAWARTARPLLETEESLQKAVPTSTGIVYIERVPDSGYSRSVLHLQWVSATYQRIALATPQYDFSYPANSQVSGAAVGWEATPLAFHGHWGLRGDVGYQSASMALSAESGSRVSLHLFPLSVGAVYLADFHPVLEALTPTAELGATYVSYLQTGDIDGTRLQNGTSGLYTSFGLRHRLGWAGLSHSLLTVNYRMQGSQLASKNLILGLALDM